MEQSKEDNQSKGIEDQFAEIDISYNKAQRLTDALDDILDTSKQNNLFEKIQNQATLQSNLISEVTSPVNAQKSA